MHTLAPVWLEFAACMMLIAVAGTRLARHGDEVATHLGLSRSWVGLILLATVTSLPELATGLGAVTVAGTPDIALGDALGSCVFNLALLAIVEALYRQAPLFVRANAAHRAAAWSGTALLLVVVASVIAGRLIPGLAIGPVAVGSLVLVAGYVIAMRRVHAATLIPVEGPASPQDRTAGRRAMRAYAVAAVVIVGGGIWLPLVGVRLAAAMGWTDSLVGTLLVALATSVPEMATTLAAMRMHALDMAVGNLLGSNLFDVLIIALDDVAFSAGPIFEGAAAAHAWTAAVAALMSMLVAVGLKLRPHRRWFGLCSWVGVALLVMYVASAAIQIRLGN